MAHRLADVCSGGWSSIRTTGRYATTAVCVGDMQRAAVRCCHDDGTCGGSICSADAGGTPAITSIDGAAATYHDAAAECAAHGLQLCSSTEHLRSCCDTGCSFDGLHVWTGEECAQLSSVAPPLAVVVAGAVLFLVLFYWAATHPGWRPHDSSLAGRWAHLAADEDEDEDEMVEPQCVRALLPRHAPPRQSEQPAATPCAPRLPVWPPKSTPSHAPANAAPASESLVDEHKGPLLQRLASKRAVLAIATRLSPAGQRAGESTQHLKSTQPPLPPPQPLLPPPQPLRPPPPQPSSLAASRQPIAHQPPHAGPSRTGARSSFKWMPTPRGSSPRSTRSSTPRSNTPRNGSPLGARLTPRGFGSRGRSTPRSTPCGSPRSLWAARRAPSPRSRTQCSDSQRKVDLPSGRAAHELAGDTRAGDNANVASAHASHVANELSLGRGIAHATRGLSHGHDCLRSSAAAAASAGDDACSECTYASWTSLAWSGADRASELSPSARLRQAEKRRQLRLEQRREVARLQEEARLERFAQHVAQREERRVNRKRELEEMAERKARAQAIRGRADELILGAMARKENYWVVAKELGWTFDKVRKRALELGSSRAVAASVGAHRAATLISSPTADVGDRAA